jgi:hypothetical protein
VADVTIPLLPVAIALTGSEQLELVQSGTSMRVSAQQLGNLALPYAGTLTSIALAPPLASSPNPITNTGTITIATGGVDNSLLAPMTGMTLKGNNSVLTLPPQDLIRSDVMTMLGAAPIDSPNFQNLPTAPTPPPGDSSTRLATTAFVSSYPHGTTNSVDVSGGTTGLTTTGGPVTTTGVITMGGTLAIASGGTGQTTKAAAFNALSPITAAGDMIVGSGVNAATVVPIGPSGRVLQSTGTSVTWAAATGTGTLLNVGLSGGTTGLTVAGSPVSGAGGTMTLGGIVATASGGTGTATPGMTQGAGISITGTWPNNTIATVGMGSVTNVSFVGGIVSVATPTTTPTLQVTGTSGGVPYFSATNGWASSTQLALNAVMTGGGPGGGPSTNLSLYAPPIAGSSDYVAVTGAVAPQASVGFQASGFDSHISVILTPKGNGALITGPLPDSTATGGNVRGTQSVDLQIIRGAATQVASGQFSTIIGGSSNTASGLNGAALGGTSNGANGAYSTVMGRNSDARARYGSLTHSSGAFSLNGDAQQISLLLRASTASTSSARLTADNTAASVTNILNLIDNSALALRIDVIGRNTSTGDMGVWRLDGAIKRGAGAATTTVVGTPATTVVALDTNWSAQAGPFLTADTANGGLNLSVVPVTANACHWVARVTAVEVL